MRTTEVRSRTALVGPNLHRHLPCQLQPLSDRKKERKKERKTYARCQACVKGLSDCAPTPRLLSSLTEYGRRSFFLSFRLPFRLPFRLRATASSRVGPSPPPALQVDGPEVRSWTNRQLNGEQQLAVREVLRGAHHPMAYVRHGAGASRCMHAPGDDVRLRVHVAVSCDLAPTQSSVVRPSADSQFKAEPRPCAGHLRAPRHRQDQHARGGGRAGDWGRACGARVPPLRAVPPPLLLFLALTALSLPHRRSSCARGPRPGFPSTP
jgi:hypothetical protein